MKTFLTWASIAVFFTWLPLVAIILAASNVPTVVTVGILIMLLLSEIELTIRRLNA